MNWKKTVIAAVITTSIVTSGLSVYAESYTGTPESSREESVIFKLSETLSVEIKSLLNERRSDGTRIGAVIRMKNDGARVARVPDYELRVKTEDGVEYTLQPSAANARSVQPKSQVELSYMATIDRTDEIKLAELTWVDVDWYVYPKKETPLLTVPAAGLVWNGSNPAFTEPSAVKKWGETFEIGATNQPLLYTPVSIEKDYTSQKPVSVVKLLVENKGEYRETLPDFTLEGRSDTKVFKGHRAEQGEITLEPGEKRYIHYAIATEQDTQLTSLNVLTTEQYVQADPRGQISTVNYSVGRLNILLPDESNSFAWNAAENYKLGDPIKMDPLNQLIHSDIEVSLAEFSMHESQGAGYKTAVAKFILKNNNGISLASPMFQTELASPDGYSYIGTRQSSATQRLMPNMKHVVIYSFIIPASESGDNLILRLIDNQSAAPYKSVISAIKVAAQEPVASESSALSFYPYEVKVNYWTLAATTNLLPAVTYSYKLKLNLDIKRQEQVVVDQEFPRMLVALVDTQGRIIAEESLSFTANTPGVRKLVSGETIVNFNNLRTEQHEYPLSIHIYEAVNTPTGEARRLVAEFKQ